LCHCACSVYLSCQLMRRSCRQVTLLAAAARYRSSIPVAPPSLQSRLLLFLSQRFHDIETILSWSSWFKNRGIRQKNLFAGQSEWFRSDRRGKFNWDFMNHRDTSIEEVDVSNTLINYTGLENLVKQRGLRTLSVSGCAEVDDWFLSRLHIFQDTLEELDISNCPRISVGGLAALQKLRGLRRLDVSSLPRLQNPGLIAILLEEMLPHCHVTAVGQMARRPDTDKGPG
uniref:Distal membrane-arm assembly complex protein 2 n=1 Tax=Salmo trutta TaxID=8032 RepID=A0A674CRX5_SALTR